MRRKITTIFWLLISMPLPRALGQGGAAPPKESLGVEPTGSYLNGSTEVVNLYNGNANISVPVLSLRGRSGSTIGLSFAYNTKQIVRRQYSDGFSGTYYKYELVYDGPNQGRWVVNNHPARKCVQTSQPLNPGYLKPRWLITTPDGAMHEMHLANTDNFFGPFSQGALCPFSTTGGLEVRYRSVNSTHMEYRYNGLSLKDGTVLGIFDTGPVSVTATNGNQVVYNFETVGTPPVTRPKDTTDTLGRKINFYYDVNHLLTSATIVGFNGQLQTFTFVYAGLHVNTLVQDPDPLHQHFHQYVPVLKEIILPNGLKYVFDYDQGATCSEHSVATSTLKLSKITYPTGGYTRYEYTYVKDRKTEPINNGDLIDKWVTDKYRNAMDGKGEFRWRFQYTTNTDPDTDGYVTSSKITNPDNTYETHTYKPVLQTDIESGMEKTVETYSSTNQLLHKQAFDWTGAFGDDNTETTRWDVRRIRTTKTLDSQQSKVETDYDAEGGGSSRNFVFTNGNVTEAREYHYGTGAPGSLARKTVKTYLTLPAYTYLNKHILDRIASQAIYDSAGALQAQTNYRYDEFALTDRTGTIPGRASGYGTTYTTRGNLTSVAPKLLLPLPERELITKTEYDILGNMVKITDPRLFFTTLSYTDNFSDAVNRNSFAYLTQSVTPKNHVVGNKYDFNSGLVTSLTDANGSITTRSYDSKNRLSQIVFPDGGQTNYAYNDVVNDVYIVKVDKIDASKNLVELTAFDGIGRVKGTQLIDPEGDVTTLREYDNSCGCVGRNSRVSNPYRSGETIYWTTTKYDALGRTISVEPPDYVAGGSNKISYFYSGNTMVVMDQAGKAKAYGYDALGRLFQAVEPDSSGQLTLPTTYEYNVLDKLTRIVQGVQVRTFGYDSVSRLKTESHPETGTITYNYDDGGNLIQKTDARAITTNLVVDELNRVTSKTYSGDGGITPAVTYSYDSGVYGKGRMSSASNSAAGYTYTYDVVGRTTRNDAVVSGTPFYMTTSYNQIGDSIETRYPDGMVITNSYNAANRLTSVVSSINDANHPPNLASAISYTPAGTYRNVSYGNGLTNTRSFNTNLQLKTLRVGSLLDFTYNYNESVSNTGRITSILDNLDTTKNLTFTYDEIYRLKTGETTGTWWGLTWSYDRYGNRLSQTATKGTPPTTSLTVDSATNRVMGYIYDASGNLADDGSKLYQYDAENRLIKITNKSSGVVLGEYQYDANGQRVKKTVNASITLFVFGIGEHLAGVWKKLYVAVAGAKVEYNGDGTMTWNYLDHLGTARAVTNKSGILLEGRDFYPFGEEWTATANDQRKYTGQIRDSESNLDYFGARYYSAGNARWISADSVIQRPNDPSSLNKYNYVRGDPINLVDRNGLWYECAQRDPETGDCLNYVFDPGPHQKERTPSHELGRGQTEEDQRLAALKAFRGENDENVKNRVAKKKCADFLNSVFKNLNRDEIKSIDDLLGNLDRANYNLSGDSTGVPGNPPRSFRQGGGTVAQVYTSGRFGTGRPDTIVLGFDFFYSNRYDPVSVLIHESFHLFAGYYVLGIAFNTITDTDLAKAAGVGGKHGFMGDSKAFSEEVEKNCAP